MTLSPKIWQHKLSFALRFINHFSQQPITQEFPVRLKHSYIKPVTNASQSACCHVDGSYRFINLSEGSHEVLWCPPFTTDFNHWTNWQTPIDINLPLPTGNNAIVQELWPTPSASVEPGMTAIRGKLVGNQADSVHIRIARNLALSTSYSFSDQYGEFLFLFPMPERLNNQGRLELTIELENGSRNVIRTELIQGGAAQIYPGANFQIMPGRESRVRFFI